jgi:phosphorylcholine metabolism protein LicD
VEAPVETPATPAEETPAALAEDTNDDVFTILRGAYRDESIDENELAENKVELKAMRKAAPLATELTNDTETDASLSDTAEAATVYTEEQISESGVSLSTVESELSSTSEQLSTSASEAESEYESYSETMTTTSEDYASKNYNIAKLDKLEQDVKAAQKLIKTIKPYRDILSAKLLPVHKKRKGIRNILAKIVRCIPISRKQLILKIDRLARTYEKTVDSNLVGIICFNIYVGKEIMPIEWFGDIVKMEFEGHQFNVPSNYEAVLRHFYGNWQQLPPEEQRVTHHDYEVYKSI